MTVSAREWYRVRVSVRVGVSASVSVRDSVRVKEGVKEGVMEFNARPRPRFRDEPYCYRSPESL